MKKISVLAPLFASFMATTAMAQPAITRIDCSSISNILCGILNGPQAAGTNRIGYVSDDPCQQLTKTFTPINIAASGSAKIITGTAAKKTYICHIHLVVAAANNVAVTEGSSTNCASGTAGLVGGTTAASGWNFSANGGISLGMGGYSVLATATNQDDVCLNPSSSTQVTGVVAWVQQ